MSRSKGIVPSQAAPERLLPAWITRVALADSWAVQSPIVLGNYRMVADARLYNREELQRQFPETDRGAPDGELLVRAYAAWGTDCLNRIRGDFAFVLWDGQRHRLFCGRDPLGLRPFYYRWHAGRFACASDIKTLRDDPDYTARPNEAQLADYLLGWSSLPDLRATFYDGIEQLPAGHSLVLEEGRLEVRRYWRIDPTEASLISGTVEENAEEFRRLFQRALEQRMAGEKVIGILLSGGLDSTAIAGLACQQGNSEPALYFLNYYYPTFHSDERQYVRAFEEQYRRPVDYLGGDSFRLLDGLDEVAQTSETPYLAPQWSTLEEVTDRFRQAGVRVVLTGYGGDHVFPDAFSSCLDRFHRQGWIAGARNLHAWARSVEAAPRSLWPQVIRRLLPPRVKVQGKRLLRKELPSWIRPEFARRSGLLEKIRRPAPRPAFPLPSRERIYRGLTSGRIAAYLAYYAHLGRQTGLEFRFPFFDPAVARFLLLAPWEQHSHNGEIKVLLRQATRGVMPETVRQRKDKGGPDSFLLQWLRHQEAHRLESLATEELLMVSYVLPERARDTIRKFLRGETDRWHDVWLLISLETWLRSHFGRSSASPTK